MIELSRVVIPAFVILIATGVLLSLPTAADRGLFEWLRSNAPEVVAALFATTFFLSVTPGVFAPASERGLLSDGKLYDEREHFVQELTKTIPDIVYVYDLELGQLIYLNDRVTNVLGYKTTELLHPFDGLLESFIHPDDLVTAPRWSARIAVLKPDEVLEHKFRIRHKNGEWRWMESREVVLKQNPSGGPAQIMAVANDITDRVKIEQKLKEIRERNSSILKAFPDLMFVQDADGNYLDYYARDPRSLLAPPEDFLGKNMREVLPPEILDLLLERFDAALQSDEPQGCEYKACIAGEDRAYECRIIKCGVDKVLSIVRDITEQKRMAEALLRSEQFNRAVIESSNDVITILDLKGRVLFTNERATDRFNVDQDRLLGRSWAQFWPQPDRSAARDQLKEARNGGIGRFHSRTAGSDGKDSWWDIAITPMSGPDGDVARLLAISRDVTAQKEAEEKLQTKETFFRSLVENAHDLVTVMKYDATILYESPSCERTLGYPVEEKIGKNCLNYLHPDDKDRVSRELTGLVEGKWALRKLEYRYLHRSGTYIPLEVIARLSTDENGEPIVIVNKRDITERKQKEGQLRKLVARLLNVQDEERRRLARELHDETAQNLVLLDINLASIEKALAEGSDDADEAISQSRTLIERSLREVRTVSYLLHPPMLDEAGLQTALSWLIRGFSQRSGIQVKFDCLLRNERFSSDIEIAVYRIIQEGLTNIHRHSGSRTAQVKLQRKADSLILTIADQGCGIPDTVVEKRGGGIESIGVGIPGMRERLHLLGGRLDVRSDEAGTSLMAVIPLRSTRS